MPTPGVSAKENLGTWRASVDRTLRQLRSDVSKILQDPTMLMASAHADRPQVTVTVRNRVASQVQVDVVETELEDGTPAVVVTVQ